MQEMVPISTLPLVPSFSKITKDEEKDKYWFMLLKDWQLPKHIKHFPGSHPISIERKDLEYLKKNESDFLVSLKSDGVRYILYMTYRPETDSPVCLLIDRARNMYEIEIWGSEDFYKGTIIDGELLWNLPNESTTTFLAFDILQLKGENMKNKTYSERLVVLENIIFNNVFSKSVEDIENEIEENDKIIAMNNLYNLTIKAKHFTPPTMLPILWKDRLNSQYRHDGLIFTKNLDEYKLGSAENSIYKWKPCYSIDVVIKENKIYCNSFKTSTLECIENILEHKIELTKSKLNFTENDIVECDVQKNGNTLQLFPMRVRLDKDFPNTMKTIVSSCEGVVNKVTIEELFDLFK